MDVHIYMSSPDSTVQQKKRSDEIMLSAVTGISTYSISIMKSLKVRTAKTKQPPMGVTENGVGPN